MRSKNPPAFRRSAVLVNATHTHHAPSTGTVHGYQRDTVFIKRVQDAIVKSVETANAHLANGDSEFLFKLGEENTVGANSRVLLSDNTIWWTGPLDDPLRHTGPFDPQLPVLAFRGADQKLRAVDLQPFDPHHRRPQAGGPLAKLLRPRRAGTGDATGLSVEFLEGASGSTHNITGISPDEAVGG